MKERIDRGQRGLYGGGEINRRKAMNESVQITGTSGLAPTREKWSEGHIRRLNECRDNASGLVNRLYSLAETFGCQKPPDDKAGEDSAAPLGFMARSADPLGQIEDLVKAAHKLVDTISEEF